MKTTISNKRRIEYSLTTTESLRVAPRPPDSPSRILNFYSDISDIIEADEDDQHLDDYELTSFTYPELRDHVADAGGELCDGDQWIAFDCAHEDSQGYLTGSRSRIYVNLAV